MNAARAFADGNGGQDLVVGSRNDGHVAGFFIADTNQIGTGTRGQRGNLCEGQSRQEKEDLEQSLHGKRFMQLERADKSNLWQRQNESFEEEADEEEEAEAAPWDVPDRGIVGDEITGL